MSARLLGVIPARGGSKGLPGKNIRPLAGVPLIGHAIATGQQISRVVRTIVSTDDAEIAEVARSLGGDVPFMRPAELSQDDTPTAPVIQHALRTMEELEGHTYDGVLLLEPTSPARLPEVLEQAIDLFTARDDLDGVVAVSAPFFDPTWVGVEAEADGTLSRFFPQAAGVTRRQDNKRRFLRVNGSFYIWRSDFVRKLSSSWLDEGLFAPFEIPESQAFSIDDEEEFLLIEALSRAGMLHLPGTSVHRLPG